MPCGDIDGVHLQPVQGREHAGQRPVRVWSIEAITRLPRVVTVVVGTTGEHRTRDEPTHVRLSPAERGWPRATVFWGVQVRS